MRISRLQLEAYGPFTDHALQLAHNGHDLHLVVGPNEAGKSSLLRALSALLFGIDSRTSDAFLHPYDKLRIAATLEGEAGELLQIRRKKGNKNTLLDADEKVIDEALLRAMLGPIDRGLFENLFGLDLDRLQQGGEELLAGRGDVGRALYEAGSGLNTLNQLLTRMDKELGDLYKPRATKSSRLNVALKNYQTLHKEAQQQSLSSSKWRDTEQHYRKLEEQTHQLNTERSQLEVERRRIMRIAHNHPLFSRLDQARAELSQLGALPAIASNAAELRVRHEQALQGANQRCKELQSEQQALQEALTALQLDPRPLELAHLIEQLTQEFGSYRSSRDDLPRVERSLATLQEQCRPLLVALAPDCPPEPEAIAARLPNGDRLTLIAERLDEQRELRSQIRQLEQAREKTQRTLAALEGERAEQRVLDPSPLADLISRIRALGPLEQQLASEQQKLATAQRQLTEQLQRELHWQASAAALRSSPAPDRERLHALQQQWEQARQVSVRLELQLAQEQEEWRQIETRLNQLSQSGEPPTHEQWQALRAERDASLQQLLDGWQLGRPFELEQINRFGRQIERSDHYAEQLLHSSQESAAFAQQQRLQSDTQARIERLQQQIGQAGQQRQQLHDRTTATLAPLQAALAESFVPSSPAAVIDWLDQRDRLLVESEHLAEAELQQSAREKQIDDLCVALDKALREYAVIPLESGLSALLTEADRLLERLTSEQQQRRDREQYLSRLKGELREQQQRLETEQRLFQQAQEEWLEQIAVIGMGQSDDLDTISLQLRQWRDLATLQGEMQREQRRILGMRERMESYAGELGALAQALGLSTELAIEQTISRCSEALKLSLQQQQRQQTLKERLEQTQAALAQAEQQCNRESFELDELCRQAGVDGVARLPEVEQRVAEARQLQQQITQLEQRIAEEHPDLSEAQLRAELTTLAPDACDPSLHTCEERLEACQQELQQASEQLGELRSQLNAMDGGDSAARREMEASEWLAQAQQLGERYLHLRLANFLLQRTIDHFREENQTPLLARASQHFAQLTDHSFTLLHTDFDEQGKEQLVAQRATGGSIGVEKMSLGTVDQLYFALRIAAIERHIEHHPAVPVVLDDVLVQFDDQRTSAALRLLAELATRTQVIYFSHHPHLAELAESALGSTGFHRHTL